MKKKIITIGTAGLLVLMAILVSPVIGAENLEIIENIKTPTEPLSNDYLKEKYYTMVNKISNSQFPKDELETLYQECWFEDDEGEIVTVYEQIKDIFGVDLADNVDVLFGEGPHTLDVRESAMSNICDIFTDIKADNQNIISNCMGAFDFIKNNQDITFDDFPEESREWAEESYNLIKDDIQEKPFMQNLISKILNSQYFTLEQIDMDILIICLLYLIVLAGVMVMPMGDNIVGIAEGAMIGAGFAMLMSEANLTKPLADVIEFIFGFLIPGVDWEASAAFILGLVAFLIYFTLFKTFRVVRLAGGIAAAVGGCVAIYMIFTLFIDITEWKSRSRSTTAQIDMPFMKVIMLKLLQRIAPRLQRFGMCC